MVPRTELLAAQSEAKAHKEEALAKAKDLGWMEAQLARAQEQLTASRAETSQLQAALGATVPKVDLESARAQRQQADAAAQAEAQKQREAAAALQAKLAALEGEKAALGAAMQVRRNSPLRARQRF